MRSRISVAVLIMGFSGLIAQILRLREFLIVFAGNKFSTGIILADWLILEAFGSFYLGKKIEKTPRTGAGRGEHDFARLVVFAPDSTAQACQKLDFGPFQGDAQFVQKASDRSVINSQDSSWVIAELGASNRGIGNMMVIASSRYGVSLVFEACVSTYHPTLTITGNCRRVVYNRSSATSKKRPT